MPFGVYVAAPLLDVCVKKNEGYLSWFACRAVRQVRRLPIAAIIDDGASAGAIAAICENALLGDIQCIRAYTAWHGGPQFVTV